MCFCPVKSYRDNSPSFFLFVRQNSKNSATAAERPKPDQGEQSKKSANGLHILCLFSNKPAKN
jgi:hypothetical protein